MRCGYLFLSLCVLCVLACDVQGDDVVATATTTTTTSSTTSHSGTGGDASGGGGSGGEAPFFSCVGVPNGTLTEKIVLTGEKPEGTYLAADGYDTSLPPTAWVKEYLGTSVSAMTAEKSWDGGVGSGFIADLHWGLTVDKNPDKPGYAVDDGMGLCNNAACDGYFIPTDVTASIICCYGSKVLGTIEVVDVVTGDGLFFFGTKRDIVRCALPAPAP